MTDGVTAERLARGWTFTEGWSPLFPAWTGWKDEHGNMLMERCVCGRLERESRCLDHSQIVVFAFGSDGELESVEQGGETLWSAERGDTAEDALASPLIAAGLLDARMKGGHVTLPKRQG